MFRWDKSSCMTKTLLTPYQKQLVEKLGVFYEKNGLSPVAARILALLLVSARTELTFDEIREELSISKSATSNALNLLLTTEQIEYITLPGDRKRYFRSMIINWQDKMKQKMNSMIAMTSLMTEVQNQRPVDPASEFNNSLNELISFMNFFHKEIPGLFDKWRKAKDE